MDSFIYLKISCNKSSLPKGADKKPRISIEYNNAQIVQFPQQIITIFI